MTEEREVYCFQVTRGSWWQATLVEDEANRAAAQLTDGQREDGEWREETEEREDGWRQGG